MTFLLYILPIIFLIRIFNHYYSKNLTLRAENDVRVLRNKLRISAIESNRLVQHPAFVQVDYIIARSEKAIKAINLWVLLYEVIFKKTTSKKERVDFDKMLDLKGDVELKSFYDSYSDIAFKYIVSKNIFSLLIALAAMKTTKHLSMKLQRLFVRTKDNFRSHLIPQY